MASKKPKPPKQVYKKKDSAYKTPEFNENQTLFATPDGDSEDENDGEYQLSDGAKVDKFLTTWAKRVRPFKAYAGFRKLANTQGVNEIYTQIKIKYRIYVLSGEWDEEKFEYVLDKVFSDNQILVDHALKRYALMYDNGGVAPTKNSGTTSALYDATENNAKMAQVLDAWAALDELEED